MAEERLIALVTGASSGFGEAIARKLAAENYDLILCARRADRLERLSKELMEKEQVKTLTLDFDIQIKEDVIEAFNNIPEEWLDIDVLINNAGLALEKQPLQEGSWDDWDTMIQTNVNGLLYISRLVMPIMVERKKGFVINIGSTAGRETYLGGNIYAATKHAVDAISKSMRIDLLKHGIRVSQIRPGAAITEFSTVRYKGDKERTDKIYDGFDPLLAEDVANAVSFVLHCPPHMCVNDMEITATAQANAHNIVRKDS